MVYKKICPLFFVLAAVILLSGCVSMQECVGTGSLNREIKEKDARIKNLQEIVDDQQEQLRQLNDSLLECRAGK